MTVSDYVVAAICGNWYSESGMNPNMWESQSTETWSTIFYKDYRGWGHGGFGLGQWTNTSTSAMRLQKMHNWVTSNGYQDGDGTGQVKYFLYENVWFNKNSRYSSLSRFLSSTSTDTRALAEEFLNNWEGWTNSSARKLRGDRAVLIQQWMYQNRKRSGWIWYNPHNQYLGGKQYTLSHAGCNSERFNFQVLNNIFMVKQILNNGSYEPVPEGSHTIAINIEGNGEAFPSSPEAEAGTIIDIWESAYGDDYFEGWEVEQGDIEIEETSESPSGYRFTMGDEDVIIKARFTGDTPPIHEGEDIPEAKKKSKSIYYIPWWAKYRL